MKRLPYEILKEEVETINARKAEWLKADLYEAYEPIMKYCKTDESKTHLNKMYDTVDVISNSKLKSIMLDYLNYNDYYTFKGMRSPLWWKFGSIRSINATRLLIHFIFHSIYVSIVLDDSEYLDIAYIMALCYSSHESFKKFTRIRYLYFKDKGIIK